MNGQILVSQGSAVLRGRYGAPLTLRSVRATGAVRGLLFELAVEQHYCNDGADNVEAVYTFPLPWGAVLLDLEVSMGGKVLRGVVRPRAKAEAAYEDALEQGDTAILLERAADGLYTVSLGNLMAGEKASIRYRYTQLLRFEQGAVRITVPTVVAPRYGDAAAMLAPHQMPGAEPLASYPFDIAITLDGQLARARIGSPTHPITLQAGDGRAEVALSRTGYLDRDFVLSIDGLQGQGLTTVGRDGDGYVALASFCPELRETVAAPLRLKVVVDCSGSMAGGSIAGAQRALHEVLSHLQPQDRFSCTRFGNNVEHHSEGMTCATGRAVRHAAGWVERLRADMGGTEIGLALNAVYQLDGGAQADLLLVTDGEVWETEELIRTARDKGQRIFAIGVGSAPASSLLRQLAEQSRGACELVASGEEAQDAIVRMFRRMRQSGVDQVSVQWPAAARWQVAPSGALFARETLHAFAGFEGAPPAVATLTWREAGVDDTQRTQLRFDGGCDDGDTLARMAASLRLLQAEAGERLALAVQYQLVTEATSFLIVHERQAHEKALRLPVLQHNPNMLAAGWGGVGQVAQPGAQYSVAVWRRESASEQVRALMDSGMEAYAVPAFLRKSEPVVRADALSALLKDWAREGARLPSSFAVSQPGLPWALREQLQLLVEAGYGEADVFAALLAALMPMAEQMGLDSTQRGALARLAAQTVVAPALQEVVGEVLAHFLATDGAQRRRARWWHRLLPRKHDDSSIPAFLRKHAD
ncbi:VWA domain-containing protein [Duganella sp. LX20W]|uniref:VWA domain-containing protein n=1 Tax=Rugamonas brunnea TaxID=2758569 RepID=A0A7W2EQ52_9BURK|nr:VIT domain-containing protein [Rugamonas brunnea]MBA5636587.1 VWA domain-containing protein [Rugamonas brunnea]